MKDYNLCEVFKHYEGQPVVVYTDDGRIHCGIDCAAYDGAVRLIDKCGRIMMIEYRHIDTVVEPQMRVHECCRHRCKCDERENEDRYFDDDCFDGRDDDDEEEEENGRKRRRNRY